MSTDITIVGPIDSLVAVDLVARIRAAEGGPLTLTITSPGGDFEAGRRLAVALRAHGKAHGVARGAVVSAAGIVWMSCATRRMEANASLRLHHCTVSSWFQNADAKVFQLQAEYMRLADGWIDQLVREQSGGCLSLDEVRALLVADRAVGRAEAETLGFIRDTPLAAAPMSKFWCASPFALAAGFGATASVLNEE